MKGFCMGMLVRMSLSARGGQQRQSEVRANRKTGVIGG